MINFDINKNIEKQFDEIAIQLFNETSLTVNNKEYLITEIEFYVYHKIIHPDPFVHGDKRQLTSNQIYFHGSGIDITIGKDQARDDNKTYGGVLIRGLKSKNENNEYEYYDGPLNLVREIFDNFNLLDSEQRFGFKNFKGKKNEVFKAPRIGLNPINKVGGKEFSNRNYRYLTDLIPSHKYKSKGKVDDLKKKVS